jgi:hypothetical protein
VGEFIIFYKKNKRISEEDKSIIKELLETLNINETQEMLEAIPHDSLIPCNYLKNISAFLSETDKLKNKIINKRLNKVLFEFISALKNYFGLLSENVFMEVVCKKEYYAVGGDWRYEKPRKFAKLIELLDKLAAVAYNKFKKLIEYVKRID